MKTNHYWSKIVHGKFAGDADGLANELVIGIVFGMITVMLWRIEGWFFAALFGAITLLCITRIIFTLTAIIVNSLSKKDNDETINEVDYEKITEMKRKNRTTKPNEGKNFKSRRFYK